MRWRRAFTGQDNSGNYHKVDITLDEEDLMRLVAQHLLGINPAELTVRDAWQILEGEAEYLLLVEQQVRLAYSTPENKEMMEMLPKLQAALFDKLREKYTHDK